VKIGAMRIYITSESKRPSAPTFHVSWLTWVEFGMANHAVPLESCTLWEILRIGSHTTLCT